MPEASSENRRRKAGFRQLRLLPLIAATFFMVSGGPYGIEDIIGGAGYRWALLLLLCLPVLWSLPTALMIGELASALPAEGGFYVWVRRALGPFWGFQEAWLSLAASIFDMAIYPTLFTLYLGRLAPALTAGHRGLFWSLAVLAALCPLEPARRRQCGVRRGVVDVWVAGAVRGAGGRGRVARHERGDRACRWAWPGHRNRIPGRDVELHGLG